GIEILDPAGVEVDALDAPAAVVAGLVARNGEPAHVVPLEAAVVADVDLAVGADGRAVRTTARVGDHRERPVGRDARQRAAADLDDEDAAVGQRDRALGELQAARDLAHLAHAIGTRG